MAFSRFGRRVYYNIKTTRLPHIVINKGDPCLKGVIFDLAGTIIDPGVKAPAMVFCDIFKKFNVPITIDEARKDMGNNKKVHLEKILQIPRIRNEWIKYYHREPEYEDVEDLYYKFEPEELKILPNYSDFVPNALNTLNFIKSRYNVKLGCTTGYMRSMVDIVTKKMSKQGFALDCTVASDEVRKPRPFGDGCFANMDTMGITEPHMMVKVGDTTIDIDEGKNAGMWTVGVVDWGNYVGLNVEEFDRMRDENPDLLKKLLKKSSEILLSRSPDFLINDITGLPSVLEIINGLLREGYGPEKKLLRYKEEEPFLL
jgi:phosphonoacetaldehyde hydrolase